MRLTHRSCVDPWRTARGPAQGLLALALLTLLVAALAPAPAAARDELVTEVFTVGYRPVDEVIDLIRPLVPAPGHVGGMRDQLVVRTTPQNMAEIRRVLQTINKAPANLQISVRSTLEGMHTRRGIETYGTNRVGDAEIGRGEPSGTRGLTIGQGSSGVRIVQTHSEEDDRTTQRVRVLEGQQAFISTGQSVPVADRSVSVSGSGNVVVQQGRRGVTYRNATRGFYVRPRLAGNQVTLEIMPFRTSVSRESGGAFDVDRASTVVSGPLGEWIAIGDFSSSDVHNERGITAATVARRNSERTTYVKVDRVD